MAVRGRRWLALRCAVSMCLVAGALLTAIPSPSWAARPASIVSLGTLPGGTRSYAVAINNKDEVAGYADVPGGDQHAFRWRAGRMVDLGTLGGNYSSVTAMNDRGHIIGNSRTASGQFHGFIWRHGRMKDLGTLGGTLVFPAVINRFGTVTGSATTVDGRMRAFRWQDGVMRALPMLPGDDESSGSDINDNGQMAGYSRVRNGRIRAVVWRADKTVQALGVPAGDTYSAAARINNAGDIAGTSGTDELPRAVLWKRSGRMLVLADRESTPTSLNDRGEVAVQAAPSPSLFIWRNGKTIPLRGASFSPYAVNNRGWFAGAGTIAGTAEHALVWHGGRVADLGTLPGDLASLATSINRVGHVVGFSVDGGGHRRAVLWRGSATLRASCPTSTGETEYSAPGMTR